MGILTYIKLGIAAAMLAALIGGFAYVKHLQHAAATALAQRDAETLVAENNRHAAEAIVVHQKQMEDIRAGNQVVVTKRNTAVTAVIEGITHEPTVQTPSAADLNDLGDRLRKLEADNHS